MITELPKDARQCSLSGVFITPDARVFKAGKNGFREVTVKADKKGPGKFYNSAEKKYYSLTQAYAEAFVPTGEQKPLAFIKDASHGLDPANIMWATNDEWREYWKEHAERKCKCCGKLVEKDMAGGCVRDVLLKCQMQNLIRMKLNDFRGELLPQGLILTKISFQDDREMH